MKKIDASLLNTIVFAEFYCEFKLYDGFIYFYILFIYMSILDVMQFFLERNTLKAKNQQ